MMLTDHFEHGGIVFHEVLWKPASAVRGIILIVHGIGEHSGRYQHVADFFNSHGYLVASYDQRGHGRSGGEKGYIDDWQVMVDDLGFWFDRMQNKFPDLPIFMVAHSLGGLEAFHFVVDHQPALKGIILSAPALVVSKEISPLLQKLAPLLGRWFPRLKASKLNAHHVSRDPEVVRKYINDPLVNNEKMYARTGATVLEATRRVSDQYDRFTLPFLVMHGTDDKLTDPEGSRLLYAHGNSEDKSINIYQGLYHELMNEPEQQTVLTDMLDWLKERR